MQKRKCSVAYEAEDACSIPHGGKKYTVCFADKMKDYTSLDTMMNDKFFDGKLLSEIARKLSLRYA